jgi:hypothetical protein
MYPDRTFLAYTLPHLEPRSLQYLADRGAPNPPECALQKGLHLAIVKPWLALRTGTDRVLTRFPWAMINE